MKKQKGIYCCDLYNKIKDEKIIIYRMQSSNNSHLPKLKIIEPSTKMRSSNSNIINQSNKLHDDKSNIYSKPIDERNIQSIKQSRSKSSNYGFSQFKVQYKYISKSPEYFKKKQRSLQSLEPSPYQDGVAMEKYIDEKMKKFNKDSLINLAREGMLKQANYRHRVVPKKKTQIPVYDSITRNMHHIVENETKYSSFNPAKIVPLMHSLQKIYPSNTING